ncbi:hypothetical protein DEJ30_04995 [Curtobacterium sp. MCPF17_003]|nr:hypothetical protein DEJ30_04995 [Curtobacterium sp. MCPF17_003]
MRAAAGSAAAGIAAIPSMPRAVVATMPDDSARRSPRERKEMGRKWVLLVDVVVHRAVQRP